MERPTKASEWAPVDQGDPWTGVEAVRIQRLREQGRRSLSENLAEAIVLSRKLAQIRIIPRRR